MIGISSRRLAFGAAVAVSALSIVQSAQAEDFLSALFGGFGRSQRSESESAGPLSYAPERSYGSVDNFGKQQGALPSPRPAYSGGNQAYCVRTCDGRYFPISAADGQSRAASCNSFCPASETKVVYGSTIDHAATETGKSYSSMPNAYRYRTELVASCTCNGKDQIGLAPVKIEDDKTVRRGDIVAGPDGLMMAGRSADKRGASLNMSPASASIRAKYDRVPIVAAD